MAHLYFRYGTMNSAKSAHLLIATHNYEEQGKKILCFSPSVDTRSGVAKIKSRIAILEHEAIPLYHDTDVYETFLHENMKVDFKIACVFGDEVQFYTDKQIEDFARIVDELDVAVILYGLKVNFKGKLFSGSKRLLELADKIQGLKTMCWYCSRAAHMVLRYVDGVPVYDGPEVLIGGNDTYKPVCRVCFFNPPKVV